MGLTINEIKKLQECLTRIPSIRAGEIISALHLEGVMEEFSKGFELSQIDIDRTINTERRQKQTRRNIGLL